LNGTVKVIEMQKIIEKARNNAAKKPIYELKKSHLATWRDQH